MNVDPSRLFVLWMQRGSGHRPVAVLLAVALAAACTSQARPPHPDLIPLWRDFLQLPAARALAIAGHPTRDRWVAGASGGHETIEQAEEAALAQCRKRRRERRLQARCVLYAIGDEILWGR